ncbi:MAG: cupin domain-containing protein [Desulfovibrio sp.]|nr:cupin domain-containing protein [Desulfovibrio sp.]MBI4957893.1 cupin domain-containing protein [Desulfovibrio sp.]
MAKRIITEADILKAHADGAKELPASSGECIVTEQARDRALELGIALTGDCASDGCCPISPASQGGGPGISGPAVRSGSGTDASRGSTDTDRLVSQVVAVMRDKLPSGADDAMVERLVREAVASKLAPASQGAASAEPMADETGVRFIDSAKLLAQSGQVPLPGKAVLAEALGRAGETKLAAGYLCWERASFNRVVDAPEVGVVIAGELHLTVGGQTMIGKPGDMIYLPKGAKVIYSTPSKVTLACVNGPA